MAIKTIGRRFSNIFDFTGPVAEKDTNEELAAAAEGSTFYAEDTGDPYIKGVSGWVKSYVLVKFIAGDLNIGNVDVVSLPGTVQADIAALKAKTDTIQADTALIKASVAAATPAGEAHIGEVGHWSDLIVVTPAIAAAAFSANDVVGGKLTLAGSVRVAAGKGKITGLKLVDKSKQNADLLIFIFGADLAGTYADNSAEAVTAADWLKWIGTIKILSTDYEQMANASLVDLGFEMDVEAAAGTTLYALIVTTGTPAYAENALQLTFAVGEGS